MAPMFKVSPAVMTVSMIFGSSYLGANHCGNAIDTFFERMLVPVLGLRLPCTGTSWRQIRVAQPVCLCIPVHIYTVHGNPT